MPEEGGRDTVRRLAARLDAHFGPWAAALTAVEREALEAYLGDRNFFRAVNAVLRGADLTTVPAHFVRRVLPARRAEALDGHPASRQPGLPRPARDALR